MRWLALLLCSCAGMPTRQMWDVYSVECRSRGTVMYESPRVTAVHFEDALYFKDLTNGQWVIRFDTCLIERAGGKKR